MLERILLIAVIIGAAYWYWSGPYQDRINPDYDSLLQENEENMARCMRGAAYRLGATGAGPGADQAEKNCAEQYNLYEYEGRWHSYDITRPDQ